MPTTYEPIATTTLGTAAADITFSSIPATYTDLILRGSVSSTDPTFNRALRVQFNADTSTLYSTTILRGEASTTSSVRDTTTGYIGVTEMPLGTNFLSVSLQINNYSNTTTNKSTLSTGGMANGINLSAGLYRSTAAISSLKLFLSGLSFRTGSSLTLYGIKAA